MLKILYIGIGGFMGASSRYLLSKWIEIKWDSLIPNGTLVVNTVGSFLIGFLMILFLEKVTGFSNLKILLTTGFLGAFTTFSTFSYETMVLLEEKSFLMAGINIFGNLTLGILAVLIGIIAGKAI
ncbi:MAG TPA: fluoride efflux transporter CrcB [Halanaerobiales bacterium]|nr:fluoride efflux transporter CrcB [Halanaerobiales bacterium]